MSYRFNNGNGAFTCDYCCRTILDYLPQQYVNKFLEVTKKSGQFKGVSVWSKADQRFCSARCMKDCNNENSSMADAIYGDKLRDN